MGPLTPGMPASGAFIEEIGPDKNSGDWWNLPKYKGGIYLLGKVFQAEKIACVKDGATKNTSWWPIYRLENRK